MPPSFHQPCSHLSHVLPPQGFPVGLVQFSCSVVSDSLRPHEPQHARPPCPSPAPRVHPIHVYQVGDDIQPSHPLLSPSPPALNLSLHQGLFQWVHSLHQVAKVLELIILYQSEKQNIKLCTYNMILTI